jgi:hypothetical protein
MHRVPQQAHSPAGHILQPTMQPTCNSAGSTYHCTGALATRLPAPSHSFLLLLILISSSTFLWLAPSILAALLARVHHLSASSPNNSNVQAARITAVVIQRTFESLTCPMTLAGAHLQPSAHVQWKLQHLLPCALEHCLPCQSLETRVLAQRQLLALVGRLPVSTSWPHCHLNPCHWVVSQHPWLA